MTLKEMYDMGVDYMYPSGEIMKIADYKHIKETTGEFPKEGVKVIDPLDGEILGYVSNEDFANACK